MRCPRDACVGTILAPGDGLGPGCTMCGRSPEEPPGEKALAEDKALGKLLQDRRTIPPKTGGIAT